MKKIFKSCTFWFAIASVSIISLTLLSSDSNNTILIFSNYPLHLILRATGFTLYLPNALDHTFFIQNLFIWFKWHFISLVCYGLIIDAIRVIIKKRKATFN